MAKDRFKYFRVESREILDQLARALLALDKGDGEGERVVEMLRLAHTLKGAARVVGAAGVAHHAHALEDILAPFRKDLAGLGRVQIDGALSLLDAIGADLAGLDAPDPKTREAGPGAGSRSGLEAVASVRIDLADLDRLLGGLAEATSRLDTLRRQLTDPGRPAKLAEDLEKVATDLSEVRALAGDLRLVPISLLFGSLERAARDAAMAVDRQVTFETEGGEIRIDAHVLVGLSDAVGHLVRNAVAHGIESPAERLRTGKPAEGRIRVAITREGDRVRVSCRDDGRGIDLAGLRKAAVSGGLLSAGEAAGTEIAQLIFRGGITTSRGVTQVAGRGVGLDAVRSIAERLKGEVAVETWPGSGTRFDLVVPTSLASLAALLAEVGGKTVAFPLDAVRDIARVPAGALRQDGLRPVFAWNDRALPFLRLDRLLGVSRPAAADSSALTVLCLAAGGQYAALGVSRLLGMRDVLVRPLPPLAGPHPLVAGAFLDGDGTPLAVLDPSGVVAAAHGATGRPAAEPPPRTPAPILVIDDSLTTRMLEQSVLESAGFDVDVAISGEEGWERALQRPYGLFIVDIEMPGMDGFEFVSRVRRDARLQATPCIIVTSLADERHRRRSEDVGARAFIVKSEFQQERFLAIVRDLVT